MDIIIDIFPGWLLLASLILPPSLFFLIRKILLSDYFYNKTGRKLYYIRENGSRAWIDSVNLIVNTSYMCCLACLPTYVFSIFAENYFFFHLGLILCGLFTYCDIIIFLRMKFFYYEGDKFASEKRYYTTYPLYSGAWTLYTSMFSTLIIAAYFSLHRPVIMYSLIILLITIHVLLFPDYMNKVLPWDVRTERGFYIETTVIISIVYYIVLYITLFN